MTTPPARRLAPSELKGLDLSLSDPRIHWAKSARSSSNWSESYAASSACGPPSVFPEDGDRESTWLAASGDARPWLEVEMPALTTAHAVLICETCGPGGIVSVRDQDGAMDLFVAEPRALQTLNGARLFVVPLDPTLPAPSRIRIGLKRSDEYQEIDAVALVTVPFEELMAAPVTLGDLRHRRFAPEQLRIHDLRGDRRIVWAQGAKASSVCSSSYEAKAATGRPKVFPKGGDHSGTWLSDTNDRNAWLELTFGKPVEGDCYGFIVLETCGAGAVVRATDEKDRIVWQAGVEKVPHRQARLLHVPLEPGPAPKRLRLHVSGAIDDYREIDAVALLYGTLADLATEAPPPPAPPIPGAPPEGFTFIEGTLLGVSAAQPLVHATVRSHADARAVTWGPPLRLRLSEDGADDGDEVALELGDTSVFGDPLLRRRGRFSEVAAALPELAGRLQPAPAEGTHVVVQGQQITESTRVHVAGIPEHISEGGFRERANAPERMRAAIISRQPLSETPFLREGTRTFSSIDKLPPDSNVPHPLQRWMVNAVRVAGLAIGGALIALMITADGVWGWSAAVLGVALTFALSASVYAIELIGRVHTVFVVGRKQASKRNGRVGFTQPGWTLTGVVVVVGIATSFLALTLGTMDGDARDESWLGALVLAGSYALVRVLLWQWTAAPLLWTSMRALMGRTTTGALTGAHRSTEQLAAHIKHLGTEQYVDNDGRTGTRERYKEWNTRSARADHQVTLALADGRRARPQSPAFVIDVGMTPLKVGTNQKGGQGGTVYGSFASEHEAGDVASLIGEVVVEANGPAGGNVHVNDAIVLLGPRTALVRRTIITAACLSLLWGIVFVGLARVAWQLLPYV